MVDTSTKSDYNSIYGTSSLISDFKIIFKKEYNYDARTTSGNERIQPNLQRM